MATPEQRDLMYLFERPSDPLYVPRAGNTVVFNLPADQMPAGFAPSLRFGPATPNVINVETNTALATALPDLVKKIPRSSPFSLNFRQHRLAAKIVIDLLQQSQTVAQLRDTAASIRGEINETLFVYALSFVITRNKSFRGLRLPAVMETFPSRFVPSNVIDRARATTNRANSNANTDLTQPVVINHDQDFSGLRGRLENRVAYWREDYGLNAHHWHWHLIYPSDVLERNFPDRKGELFYYMHSQIIARYDMERLSVGLPRVIKLDNLREPILEGYFSKLRFDNADTNTNRIPVPGLHPNATLWGARQDNTRISNYARLEPFIPVDVAELEMWSDRLLDGIHQGFFVNRAGERVPLSDEVDITDGRRKRGVDIVGDAFEADRNLSVNYQFYGDMHNFLHVVISSCHDPDGTHGENLGVMSDSTVAMRDPVFYRLHKYIDWVFQQYKATQPSYTVAQLELPGVDITRLGVATGNVADELHTGWNRRQFEASRGIDFGTTQSVRLNLQHLDHKPFDYHILVTNSTAGPKQVYVRIFLAPKFNQNQTSTQMPLNEQRLLWTEMDKFVFNLKPGQNHIKRPSIQSSVGIPGELTFRQLEQGIRQPGDNRNPTEAQEDFCGCGWPQHLLVPRGRPEGMAFQVFVMLTDFELDRIPRANGARQCASAASYCGILDERYPDKRPMGFPFDRLPPRELRSPTQQVLTIMDLATLENMAVHDITIRFLGEQLNPGTDM